jgi:hypothetical protein
MADTNTAKYLNDNIGAVLSKALSEMAVQQPNDGVDFLSKWLKTYAEQEELKMFRETEEKQLAVDRELTQKKEAEKASRREQKVSDKSKIDDAYQKLLAKLRDPDTYFQETYWSELVDVAKEHMGAQSVYMGALDEEGLEGMEPPFIRYTHQNIAAGSPSLLTDENEVLPKMKDADTPCLTYNVLTESIPEEEHAQKCIWKPPPPPQPPVAEGEEAPPPPEGPKYLPVSVPCVTDVPTMHYFEMPRLGAYAAFPLVYPSYYTHAAFLEAKQFEQGRAQDVTAKVQKQKEREEAIAEAQEKGLEEPTFEEEEAQPDKTMTLTGTTTKRVLCMDTLGTNTLFDESKYAAMMDLCDACAECKARSEIQDVDGQALFDIDDERRQAADNLETGVPSLRETAKTNLQAPQEAEMKEIADRGLEADPKKAVEEVCYKKYASLQAKMVVGLYKDEIKKFVEKTYCVQPEVLNIMAAIAFLVGYTKAEVYPPRKTILKWPESNFARNIFGTADAFFSKIEAIDFEIGKKNLTNEQKLSFIQSLIPAEWNEEKAKEIDPAFEVLWNYLSSAIDYRTSALKQAQVEYEERKKKAEEEEQEFSEPALATLDDDFEGLATSG